jgi:hypothetical protein
LKKNPLRNRGALAKLSPFSAFNNRRQAEVDAKRAEYKRKALQARREGKPVKGNGAAKKLAKFRASKRGGSSIFRKEVAETLLAQ